MNDVLPILEREIPDWVIALIVVGAFLSLALLIQLFSRKLFRHFFGAESHTLSHQFFIPIRSLLVWGLIISGLYYSAYQLAWLADHPYLANLLDKVFGALIALLSLFTALRIFNGVSTWYLQRSVENNPHLSSDLQYRGSLLTRLASILIAAMGGVYLLRALGVDISPLLAGGAVSGLVIGLALQDTLSNLFAGFFMNIDRPIKTGDFVKLESGEEGFVEEIGWRYTKLRTPINNLVMIPNSKFSQNRLVNYNLPQPEIIVSVECGVAYGTDLERAEQVIVEVAKQVQAQVEGAEKDWEPMVRWHTFGDSAIQFRAVMRVHQAQAQFVLRSDFIKALHKRFQEEGIEIPFPIRTVYMKE